jgi:hypothetical protein
MIVLFKCKECTSKVRIESGLKVEIEAWNRQSLQADHRIVEIFGHNFGAETE